MRKYLLLESVIDDMVWIFVFKIVVVINSFGLGGRGFWYEKVGNV